MCPRPGTILNITATMSLALPSAVCVAPRTQSQRSQRSASFGRRCPQYGHGILSPAIGSGWTAGASVYSTFILTESHKPHRIRQANRIQNNRRRSPCADGSEEGTLRKRSEFVRQRPKKTATDLRLVRLPARSPLPVAALACTSQSLSAHSRIYTNATCRAYL